MDAKTAKKLGKFLKRRREERGLTTRKLGELAGGIAHSTILRLEAGTYRDLRPDKLAALAAVLEIPQHEVFQLTGYQYLVQLPEVGVYLRTKFHEVLPEAKLRAMSADVMDILQERYGVGLSAGPNPGEDEDDDHKVKATKKKGGGR